MIRTFFASDITENTTGMDVVDGSKTLPASVAPGYAVYAHLDIVTVQSKTSISQMITLQERPKTYFNFVNGT